MIRITDKTIYRAIQISLVIIYFSIGYISYKYLDYDASKGEINVAFLIFTLWAVSIFGIMLGIILLKYDDFEYFMRRLSKGKVGININIPLWRQNTKQIDRLYEELGRASVDGNEALSDEIFKKIQSLEKWT